MSTQQEKQQALRNEMVSSFPEFEFSTPEENSIVDSIFGVKTLPFKPEYRDSSKSLIREGDKVYIFISSEMYPNTDRNFKYATMTRKDTYKMYKCKTWCEIEGFKRFVSAKTDAELLQKIKEQFIY